MTTLFAISISAIIAKVSVEIASVLIKRYYLNRKEAK
jgi:hypothetical protein